MYIRRSTIIARPPSFQPHSKRCLCVQDDLLSRLCGLYVWETTVGADATWIPWLIALHRRAVDEQYSSSQLLPVSGEAAKRHASPKRPLHGPSSLQSGIDENVAGASPRPNSTEQSGTQAVTPTAPVTGPSLFFGTMPDWGTASVLILACIALLAQLLIL